MGTQLQHIYNNYYKLISSTAAGIRLVGHLNRLALFLFLTHEVQSHHVQYTEQIQPIYYLHHQWQSKCGIALDFDYDQHDAKRNSA